MTQAQTARDKILIVNDTSGINAEVTAALKEENYPVEWVESGADVHRRLEEGFDLLIAPDMLDSEPVATCLGKIRHRFPQTGVLVLADLDQADRCVAALKAGATDYLVTPSSSSRTLAAIRRTLRLKRMSLELASLRQTVAMANGFDNLVGLSERMVRLKESARKLAPTDITLLITGPSGSGKELLARIVHHHSRQRRGALVSVDFSIMPQEAAAGLLFGEGNTADLTADSETHLTKADGGTLFLDNVDAATAPLQAKLAQFLRDFTIATGNDSTRREVDVRVIATATADPDELVAAGSFHPELHRLLSEIRLDLPPLCERAEDIELLADYFLRRWASEAGTEAMRICPAAVEKLLTYRWPGNVRELENCLRRATALCRGRELQPEDISFFGPGGDIATVREHRVLNTKRSGSRLDDTQRSIIARALDDNNWNFTQTAQELGIGRTTLWRKVKKYQLKRERAETKV